MINQNFLDSYKPEEVLVYLRKSRTDDPTLTVEEVLQKHETMLDEWAVKNLGAVVPEENKHREVASGETIDARPEVQALLKRAESPKYKAVLLVEIQRLSRGDLEDAGRLMKLLRYTNTAVITPQRVYDLRDDYDRDYFERELKRGNEYLEYTKRIMNNGRLLSVSQGNYIGSKPPYGYDKIWVEEGRRKCPTLRIREDEAEAIRIIFDLYVNKDYGPMKIAHHLDGLGFRPPTKNNWSEYSIVNILENVHYVGKIRWKWRKIQTLVEDGEIKKIQTRAKDGEYLIYTGRHEAIISEALFQAAQDKKGRNARAKTKTKVRNPLAGLVYCRCGRAMSMRTYKNKGVKKAEPRLLCDDQRHCGTGSCVFSEMLDKVREILADSITDFEYKVRQDDGEIRKAHQRRIERMEKQLQALEAKELAQWEAQADPDPAQRMPAEIFKKLNAKILADKAELQEALCHARASLPDPVDYEERLVRFQEALDALNDEDAPAAEKNRLLKRCIERIDYNREKPERIKSQQVRIKVDGVRKWVSPLSAGGNWTTPPIELDVKLRV